jgi:class 3 adenylate cyclase/tetratricopeptide (TPR) repeat protein
VACGTELPPDARFCPSCGTPVARERTERVGEERKLVTVLFADVTGSTELGERTDPERLHQILDTFFGAMREEIEGLGGTVEKFIGDAVMAAFGVPIAHEDDPARALRAALAMRKRLVLVNDDLRSEHGVDLEIRIGVNTGEVLVAIQAHAGQTMVTGDAVNVAARLQTAAEPGGVLVADRTARATRGFAFGEAADITVKGKSAPVRALPLVGSIDAPERGVPGLNAPMVGRDHELGLLRSLYDLASAERRPHLVTIYGEPGVGKSRLVREFLTWAETTDVAPTIVQGRCLPYGDGITYWPLAEILKRFADVKDSDGAAQTLVKVRSAGAGVFPIDDAVAPARRAAALAYTIGVEDPDEPLPQDPRQVRAEIHAAWRGLLSGIAESAAVIVVIEDIHWADPALLDLLEEIGDRAAGPLFVLCPARPSLLDRRPDWGGGRRNASSIALDALSADDAERLVALLLTIDDLPVATRRRILARGEGNPFFLEEIVRHLIDSGVIVHIDGRWRSGVGIADVRIPDTVQAVLAARIDLLAPPDKRALQLAAVVGRVFWPAPVGKLMNGDRGKLDEMLSRLQDRDLVATRLGSTISGEAEFAFKHVLTRDVAYESLPRRERAVAHATVAEWIESTATERRREFAELLAYHYEEAYRGARDDARSDETSSERLRAAAFDTLLTASRDAARRFAVQKAMSLGERALSLAAAARERARALAAIGFVALSDYRGDLAWESFREAADIRAAEVLDEPLELATCCARAVEPPTRWPGSMSSLPTAEEVRRYIDLGFQHAGSAPTTTLIRLLTARAFEPFAFANEMTFEDGDFHDAKNAGLHAADLARSLGRVDLESAALDAATSASLVVGRYGEDLPLLDRRRAIVDQIDDPVEVGDVFAVCAWSAALIGRYREAIALADEGARRSRAAGALGVALHCDAWRALAKLHVGDWDPITDELLPQALRDFGDRADDPPYFTQHLFGSCMLIHVIRGDAGRAAPVRRVIERLGSVWTGHHSFGAVLVWLAWAHVQAGEIDQAIDRLDQADGIRSFAQRPLRDQVRGLVLAEAERWDEADLFLRETRAYAADAGLVALPIHLDRLEARAAMARGRHDEGLAKLADASRAFADLEAVWDASVTDLLLVEGLIEAGRRREARPHADRAVQAFERLRAIDELVRARAAVASLDG